MDMDDVCFCAPNLSRQSRTNWRARNRETRADARDFDVIVPKFFVASRLAGNQHLDIASLLQLSTKSLDMSLDSSHVRRIEFTHVKDFNSILRHARNYRFSETQSGRAGTGACYWYFL
jgi:hypothetical protein